GRAGRTCGRVQRGGRSMCAFEVGKWLGRGMSEGVRHGGSECSTFEKRGCGAACPEWAGGRAFEVGGRAFEVGGRVFEVGTQGGPAFEEGEGALEMGERAFQVGGR
ncbi:hypothetical protein K438DRAFT_1841452, partial [Mycena galopus ATCC 62051]